MRLADIVLDLAAVASASRSVASKHVALRARQIDRFGKSSSLTARPATAAPSTSASASEPSGTQTRTAAPVTTDNAAPAPIPEAAETAARVQPSSIAGRDVAGEVAALGRDRPVAPWATRDGLFATATKPPRRPVFEAAPAKLEEVDAATAEGMPEGININIFQTSRGSKILESLKSDADVDNGGEKDASSGRDTVAAAKASESARFESLTAEEPRREPEPASKPLQNPEASERIDTTKADAADPVTVVTPPVSTRASSPAAEKVVQDPAPAASGYQLRESKVPATRLSRIWNYSGLAAGMLGGALTESISRGFGGGTSGTSAMLSPANMERLVSKLSRMRGAALKMGQMLSFQDAKMLPGPIREVLQRVQDRADYMPAWQRDRVLVANLGSEWRDLFETFEEKPIAAASIGQVHRATLKPQVEGGMPVEVAVKIQFPGVADSINSDLDNLAMLLAATKLLPKGLYLDKTIANARTELAWECDYEREAECAQRYRTLLAGDEDAVFAVPRVFPAASGKQVLTMEFMHGIGVTRGIHSFTQEQRDRIGTHILRLCLREITEFRFMQTDPNWTNFLYNAETGRLELLDFGASREYPERFVSLYVRLLYAASKGDREGVRVLSEELGYLTGHESRVMLDAHTQSVLTLAEPFLESAPEVYDFRDQTITERVKSFIPVMIKERLAPPPEETYSLHRKLSGAFLLCARLGSKVRCREMFTESVKKSGLVPEA
ncbi:hypothetical protein MCOR25_008742 [Pyricularia grisea]|uniref:ABC1 atypical kinase-like domain-containing protein n=1 Tax=Pyricularia grisea TaxID=148305 RepID=A0A6P8B4J5_PYRGI|nr:hypothetical protein PgNI_06022 [Pyricularia grisea]KAI6354125.1 hypothetical protein MCOR25_008742 [Pyricularia grisea]TLD10232.1 hypothetical protein PgNI_06022 [Pyricularia grisea]